MGQTRKKTKTTATNGNKKIGNTKQNPKQMKRNTALASEDPKEIVTFAPNSTMTYRRCPQLLFVASSSSSASSAASSFLPPSLICHPTLMKLVVSVFVLDFGMVTTKRY